MAIVNRDKDASEQKLVMNYMSNAAVATGVTVQLGIVPAPAVLSGVLALATGVSNAMQVALSANRWLSTGLTAISLGQSNIVLVNYGSSGIINGFSSGAAFGGASAVALQMGDQLVAVTSVTNGNALSLDIELSLKYSQDILSINGIQT